MTLIKYATIYRCETCEEGSLHVIRGEKDAELETVTVADDDTMTEHTLTRLRVIDLPREMSPSDYREYMDGYPTAVIDAVRDLEAQHDEIDLPDEWPECAWGAPEGGDARE